MDRGAGEPGAATSGAAPAAQRPAPTAHDEAPPEQARAETAPGRPLAEPEAAPAGAREVVLELPGGWLGEPGYEVEVYAAGALVTRGVVVAR